MVALDLRFAAPGVTEADWRALEPEVLTAHQQLYSGQGWAQDGSGWLHLPSMTLQQGLDSLCAVADDLRTQSDAVVVVGVGGSSLGTRAALEWCKPAFYNQLPAHERGGPELYFAGHSLSAAALRDLLRVLQDKRVGLLVVSKSGATTEPALAFRVLWSWLVTHVGQAEACRRTVVITDAAAGALRRFATEHGCRSFAIPANVGGRYSVLTPVGLLPLAVAGVDVRQLLQGAAEAEVSLAEPRLADNPSCLYAAVRNALYRKGKCIELLAYYEPAAAGLAEWWKQLFGESEGKEGKGLFPAVAGYTADLHALGQYVQEGRRLLFET
ncbi:MAG: glucose-6-phosphate isomerase, partial [Alicyclobacillus sp.]|nr:glucose-6-phosphate isomerase [Alicyclobacillus sp.]